MPKSALTHNQCRAKVCHFCSLKKGKRQMLVISNDPKSVILQRIRLVWPDYDPSDQTKANGLCKTCYNLLHKFAAGKIEKSKLPAYKDFSIEVSNNLADLTDCPCQLCEIAKSNEVGKDGNTVRKDLHPPKKPSKVSQKHCLDCFQVTGRGIPHVCGSRAFKKNLDEIIPDKVKEIITSDTIRERAASLPSSSTIQLRTGGGGKKMTIPHPRTTRSSSRAKSAETPISAEDWRQVMTAANLSNNQAKSVSSGIRSLKGRKTFVPNLSTEMSQLDKELQPFFKCQSIEIDSTLKEEQLEGKVSRPLFYCDDIPSLIQFLLKKRGHSSRTKYFAKIGIDKGGTWLKVCLNLEKAFDEFSSPRKKSRKSRLEKAIDESSSPRKKSRSKYRDGPNARKFKDSGVKKLIPLAFIEDAKESYDNLEKIIELCGLNSINWTPAFDMKLGLVLLGLGTAASKHPCMFCTMPKDEFANPDTICTGGELRDFDSIEENANAYQAAAKAHKGKAKLSSKDFANAEHKSLFDPDELDGTTIVVHVVPPFELHILLGLANDLFDHLFTAMEGLDVLDILLGFLAPLGLKRSEHFGGQFNGNQSIKLLQSLHLLRKALKGHSRELSLVEPILEAMECLDSVRIACFGQDLDPDFKLKIKHLADLWLKLGISVTPKCHVLFVHVAQFLDFQNNGCTESRGLGYWSEQASESVHSDFEKLWVGSAYKREKHHEDYERLALKCIVTYASRHI